jgi:hypothetical protein
VIGNVISVFESVNANKPLELFINCKVANQGIDHGKSVMTVEIVEWSEGCEARLVCAVGAQAPELACRT